MQQTASNNQNNSARSLMVELQYVNKAISSKNHLVWENVDGLWNFNVGGCGQRAAFTDCAELTFSSFPSASKFYKQMKKEGDKQAIKVKYGDIERMIIVKLRGYGLDIITPCILLDYLSGSTSSEEELCKLLFDGSVNEPTATISNTPQE